MIELNNLEWRLDEVDPEEVRLALQKVQLSESRSTDDGSKIVPLVLIAAARYAIERLTTTNQSLMAEVETLRGQVPKWLTVEEVSRKPISEYYVLRYNDSSRSHVLAVKADWSALPQALHAEEVKGS